MAQVIFTPNLERHVGHFPGATHAEGTISETGDRLAFGSTTGSLWPSEDQGDSWMTLSAHLPPVYCVRFG